MLSLRLPSNARDGVEHDGVGAGPASILPVPTITRSAIRRWQTSRGARAMGYLDGASVAALRPAVAGQPTFREREPAGTPASSAATVAPPAVSAAQQQSPPASVASAELEGLFWQSIVNNTNPADFEAYSRRSRTGCSGGSPRIGWRRCARGAAMRSRRRGVLLAAWAHRPPALGCPAPGARRSGPRPALTRVVLATFSGTVRSARKWWCWLAAVWRWAATR